MKREFLGMTEAFVELVANRLLADSSPIDGILDLSNILLLLPGARVARSVELRLMEKTVGKIFLPTCITSGTLPEAIGCHQLSVASDLEELTALIGIAAKMTESEQEALSIKPSQLGNQSALLGLAEELLQTFHELGAENLSAAQVAAKLEADFSGYDLERWQVLAGLQQRWIEALAEQNRIPRDEMRRSLTVVRQPKIIVAGLSGMNQATENLLERCDDVSAWIFADLNHADGFTESGRISTDYWLSRRYSIPERQVHFLASSADYAPAIASLVATIEPQYLSRMPSIALANEKEGRLLGVELDEFAIPVHSATGISLTDTAEGTAASLLVQFLSAPSVPLARSLIRNDAVTPHLSKKADEYLLALSKFRNQSTTDSLLEVPDALLQLLVSELNTIGRSLMNGDKGLGDALSDSGAALAEIIAEVSRLSDPQIGVENLVTSRIGKVSIPDEQKAGAFEMIGWLECPFDPSNSAFVVGCNASSLPAPLTNCQFLPESLRASLSLETFDSRRARDRYLMEVLLSVKKEVHFLCALNDTEGNPLRVSELLFSVPSPEQLGRLKSAELPISWTKSGREDRASRITLLKSFLPEPALALPDSFNVTQLETYLRDPYEYYLRYVANVRTEEEALEATPLLIGNILHHILQEFAESTVKDSVDELAIFDFFAQTLPLSVAANCRGIASPALLVQQELLRERLRKVATFQARHRAEGWKIFRSEQNIPKHLAFIEVDGKQVSIHGRIDRIDQHQTTGERILLDFKTNEKSKAALPFHRSKSGFIKLQLPFYDLLLEQTDRRPERSAFVFISRGQENVQLAELIQDDAFRNEARGAIIQCIHNITQRNFWPPSGDSQQARLSWSTSVAEELSS